MKQKKMKPIAWVAVSLILILVSCIGASLIQTDFGSVTITDVRLPMPDGETLRVLVHRPAAATPENPAPAVIDVYKRQLLDTAKNSHMTATGYSVLWR